jgi:hypothetical protein
LVGLFQLFLHKGKSNGSVHHLQHIKVFFFFNVISFYLKLFPLIINFFFYLVKIKMSGTTGPKKIFLQDLLSIFVSKYFLRKKVEREKKRGPDECVQQTKI